MGGIGHFRPKLNSCIKIKKSAEIPLTSEFNDVKEWQARRESNPDLWYRKPLFYPLNYRPSQERSEASLA